MKSIPQKTLQTLGAAALAASLGFAPSTAQAALQASDSFDYSTTDGQASNTNNLEGNNGGTGFGSAYVDADRFDVTAGSLSFGSLATSGNSIITTEDGVNFDGDTGFAVRELSNTLGDGDSFWASYLFTTEATGQFGNIAFLDNAASVVGSGASASSVFNFGFADQFESGGTDFFGMQDLTPTTNGDGSSVAVAANTTYFITIKAELTSGGDTVELFIDPDPSAGAPTVADATISGADLGTLDGIRFNANSQQASDQTTFDEFRLGDTWGDVSPIPEPSAYALIAGVLGLGFAALRRRR